MLAQLPSRVILAECAAPLQLGDHLVDEIVGRMRDSVEYPCKVVATGGLAPLIARDSRTIEEADEMLTLEGMRILYERNRG